MALFFDQFWYDARLAERGLTRSVLAAVAGMTNDELALAYKDQRELTAAQIAAFAELLGVPLAEAARRAGVGAHAAALPGEAVSLEQKVAMLEARVAALEAELASPERLDLGLLDQARLGTAVGRAGIFRAEIGRSRRVEHFLPTAQAALLAALAHQMGGEGREGAPTRRRRRGWLLVAHERHVFLAVRLGAVGFAGRGQRPARGLRTPDRVDRTVHGEKGSTRTVKNGWVGVVKGR